MKIDLDSLIRDADVHVYGGTYIIEGIYYRGSISESTAVGLYYRVPARRDGLGEELGSSQDPLSERPGVMTFGSAYPYYYGACRSGGLLE